MAEEKKSPNEEFAAKGKAAAKATAEAKKKQYSRPWLSANIMKTKERKDGLTERWVSKERLVLPKDDPRGPGEWVPDEKRHPELRKRIDDGSRIGSITELPDLVLCVAPQEWLDERNAHYASKCKTRMKDVGKQTDRDIAAAGGEGYDPKEFKEGAGV